MKIYFFFVFNDVFLAVYCCFFLTIEYDFLLNCSHSSCSTSPHVQNQFTAKLAVKLASFWLCKLVTLGIKISEILIIGSKSIILSIESFIILVIYLLTWKPLLLLIVEYNATTPFFEARVAFFFPKG